MVAGYTSTTNADPVAAGACRCLVAGCDQPSPWQRDVYIWQRVWTSAVVDAMQQASPHVDRFRILSAQWRVGDEPVVIDLSPGREAFRGQQVVPVVRLDGTRLAVSPEDVAAVIDGQVSLFEAAGAAVVAVEIDHDTATAAVGDYADWLARLRKVLPADLPLWITALPDWRHSPDIARLLNGVAAYTLQVHAVSDNGAKLMDTELALNWVRLLVGYRALICMLRCRLTSCGPGWMRPAMWCFWKVKPWWPPRRPSSAVCSSHPANWLNGFQGCRWTSRVPLPAWSGFVCRWLVTARSSDGDVSGSCRCSARPCRRRGLEPRSGTNHAAGASSFDVSAGDQYHGPHDDAWPVGASNCRTAAAAAMVSTASTSMPASKAVPFNHQHPGLLRVGQTLKVGWVHCEELDHADL